MYLKKTFLWVGLWMTLSFSLRAQCVPAASEYLEGVNVKALIHNGGDMFWDLSGTPAYEVPRTNNPAAKRHSSFSSSVWLGGFDNVGQLRMAGQVYRQIGYDFFAGPYRSTGIYDCDLNKVAFGNNPNYNGLIKVANGDVISLQNSLFEVWDHVTGTVTQHVLPNPRFQYSGVELQDGRIFLYGDDISGGLTPTTCFMVDTSTYNAVAIVTLNYFHHGSSATVLNNGDVLIAGALGTEIYNPVSNTSTIVADPTVTRAHHAAVLLPNGNVMISGGNNTSLQVTANENSIEIFNPTTGTWATGPSMAYDRARHSAILLSNGKVLIAGNFANSSITNSLIEEYDPTSGILTASPYLDHSLGQCKAIEDNNGEVYFITTKGTNYPNFQSLFMEKWDINTGQLKRLQLHNAGNEAVNLGGNIFLTPAHGGVDGEYVKFDATKDQLVDNPWQRIWSVSKAEIDQFRADFMGGSVNFANYPDIEDWPAHGDVSKGEDQHLAPFVDVNMDGRYRPATDGDYPCIKGDKALWWVYNDDAAPHTETGGQKLGLQFEVMAYTFDCATSTCPDSFVDYSTFYHYEITNKSTTYLQNAYMGVWMDADLGNYSDDYIGCDTTLGLGFCYNGDNDDESATGYGQNPPAMGAVMLKTPQNLGMTNFMYYENDFSVTGNPATASEYYNLLRSVWKDGTHLVNNGQNGYSGTAPGPSTNYIYPGDTFCTGSAGGWTEMSAGNQPFDRRFIQSFGPFRLSAGELMQLDYGVLWARDSSNLESVCRLKSLASDVINWWPSTDSTCFNLVVSNDEGQPEPASETGLLVYPNPSSGIFNIETPDIVEGGCVLEVYNDLGQMMEQYRFAGGRQKFEADLQHLPGGMYFIAVKSDRESYSKKIIIRK